MKEHQFICREPNHPLQEKVLIAKIGTSPEAPTCDICGAQMEKVWTKPDIAYATHWHWAQRYQR
jgi:hypothetical protein